MARELWSLCLFLWMCTDKVAYRKAILSARRQHNWSQLSTTPEVDRKIDFTCHSLHPPANHPSTFHFMMEWELYVFPNVDSSVLINTPLWHWLYSKLFLHGWLFTQCVKHMDEPVVCWKTNHCLRREKQRVNWLKEPFSVDVKQSCILFQFLKQSW